MGGRGQGRALPFATCEEMGVGQTPLSRPASRRLAREGVKQRIGAKRMPCPAHARP